MPASPATSDFRFEKRRAEAIVTLASGEQVQGCFFVAHSASHEGTERVGELLNSETGFFPYEIKAPGGRRTVLYNRAHLVAARLFEAEARLEPGYAVAPSIDVSILLTNGLRIDGSIRVYQPEGHYRLSDWTRQPETFRYIESGDATLIVNATHIVAVTEITGS
jgi:hypothetical protein